MENYFDIPKQSKTFFKTTDLAKYNFRIDRSGILRNVLRDAFPKNMNDERSIFGMGSLQKDDLYAIQLYDNVIEDSYQQHIVQYINSAIENKYRQPLQLEGQTRISVLGYEQISKEYECAIDKMYHEALSRVIPSEKMNPYSIYLANKMADFMNTYDYNFFTDASQIPSSQIFILFRDSQVVGKQDFEQTLLSAEEFFREFQKKKIDVRDNEDIVIKSWNRTMEKRNEFLQQCIKLAVFEDFVETHMDPEMVRDVKRSYDQGHGDPAFPNSEIAIQFHRENLRKRIESLYNPYVENKDMTEINRIYKTHVNYGPALRNRIDALRSAITQVKISEREVESGRVNDLKIFPDRTDPLQFSHLGFDNESMPFVVIGLEFRSVREFVNFAMMDDFMKMGQRFAYENRKENVRKIFENLIASKLRDAVIDHIPLILSEDFVKRKLISERNSNFDFFTTERKSRLMNFFLKYLATTLNNNVNARKSALVDRFALDWVSKRKDTLLDVYDVVKENVSNPNYVADKKSIFALWSLVMNMPRSEVIFTIDLVNQPPINRLAEEYALGELSFISMNGFNFKDLVEDRGMSVVKLFPDFSEEHANEVVLALSLRLGPYLTNPDTAAIIIARDASATAKDIWKFARRDVEIMNRLKLFYELYHVYDKQEHSDEF